MQSYSWEGEDVLVHKIMCDVFGVQKGFYVDIGAHHPFNLSNTALLYSLGWRGINVDAMPGSMALFQTHRPEDINLEIAIAPVPDVLCFSCFDRPGLNGFLTEDTVNKHLGRGARLLQQISIQTRDINSVLAEHLGGREIDLLSIDVEGFDYDILSSLSDSFRPRVIITEALGATDVRSLLNMPITKLMEGRGYTLFSRLHFSCIYVRR
jgi:FkbM family methyltransferase